MSQDQNQEKYISSREGASILGVDRQSFFYYIESRNVRRRETNDGGKDKYEYNYHDLLAIKDEIKEKRASRKKSAQKIRVEENAVEHKENLSGDTDWCKHDDLPYIYAMDCEIYGIEYSVPPTKTIQWWEKNKTAIRVLFDSKNRRDIWGCITILPIEEEAIFDLLRGDMSEQEIEAKHILAYESGKEYSCYITSCVVRPDKRKFFDKLFNSTMDYWCNHPEIHIRKLYAFALGASSDLEEAEESDGLRFVKKLFFSPRYDIGDNAWELDLDHYNPSIAIRKFQQCIKGKRERN
jgi:hypothetical protein